MSEPPFRRIGVAGLGLIGGSVALAARARWADVELIGCDRGESLDEARQRTIADRYTDDVRDLAAADLIVLATPVAAMAGLMAAIRDLDVETIVTDVGSTKRRVMAAAAAAALPHFVGGHPMAGSEQGGLAHARPDLFDGRPWMLVAAAGEPGDDGRRVERFVRGLGAAPRWTDAQTHDRVVAYVSHAPQVLAVALMNATVDATGDRGLAASGRAFKEMTRLASSPADMWQAILADNADNVSAALRDVLDRLPHQTDLADGRWVQDAFARAHRCRARLMRGEFDPE
ncbi:MAG: prephenate dehydrogenase/arogenate dehydrogenase family protein [Acidobacteria bacterium]|nr:prephenate dehydrogenase/arogenate dehydrogenase family protein [Acidobacteriota bacterium]